MDKLDKSYRRFCIEVDEFGTRTPMMIFPTQYSMLIDLGMYDYGKSETITVVLQEIKDFLFNIRGGIS